MAAATSAVEKVSTQPRTKVPTILQQAAVECGAASLAMVLAHYGKWIPLDQLRQDCGVSRDGSTALNIAKAAQMHGLAYNARRGGPGALADMPTPAIIWWQRCHFMVLEGAKDGVFHINDPARGRYALSYEDFESGYSEVALSLSKTEDFTPEGQRYKPWGALWRRLSTSRKGVTFAVIAGVLAMLLGLAIAPLSQLLVNDVLAVNNESLLPQIILALLVVGLYRGGLELLEFGAISRLQMKLTLVGTSSFTDRLLRLPLMFYLERSTGDLSQRVGLNGQVASLLANQMAAAGIAMIGAIGYVFLLLYYNVWIGIVVLVLAFVNIIALRMVTERRTTLQSRVIKRQNELRGTTASTIQGIETIKSTGMEGESFTTLTGYQAQYVSAQAQLVPSSVLLAALPTLLNSLTAAAILVMGGLFIIQGSLTIGALLAIQALAINLAAPIQTLMSTGSQVQVVTANLQSLDDVLTNAEAPRYDRPVLGPDEKMPDLSGRITFEDVSFGYSRLAEPLIKDFNLDLEPGRRVALVGVSGSGKTTIANLAAGLFAPWSGDVLYDGKPMEAYPQGVLERTLAKVDQGVVLFEGTVRENVTLWDDTIDEEHVVRALEDAQILRDVLAREGGLDAAVLENGRNFSGGQAQRLEIARALVLNPRIIILDEATSALDEITEQKVDEALRRRGVSCLIVAHRLSTIRDADEIVVLGRGGVVLERGSHDELIALEGTYAQMVIDAGEGGHVGA